MTKASKTIIGLLIVLIFGLVIAVVFLNNRLKNSSNDYAAFKQSMDNSFKKFTDKNGNEIAQVKAAVFSNTATFGDAVKKLNAAGANIQSKINNDTQGLILINKQVGGELTGKTTIAKEDTIKNGTTKSGADSIKIYPIYAVNDSNKHYSIVGEVGFNGYKLKPLFFDSTEVMPKLINNGFLKRSVLGVEVLNKSPYSKTTGLKFLQVKKNPAPVWEVVKLIGIGLGGIWLGTKL